MAICNVNQSHVKKTIRCLKIEYNYLDLEKHEEVTRTDYVDDIEDLPHYFAVINNESFMIDFKNHLYSRLSPSFKITTVDLSEKTYNRLFSVSPFKKD